MRKTILSIFLFIPFVSCKTELDVVPRNQITEETFWQTEEDAKLALIGIYDLWGGQGNGDDGFPYSFFLYFADSWSDDAYNQFGGWYESFAQGNISPANIDLAARYAELYQIIRRCNVFLDNIDRPLMDQDLKEAMSAEARFVRAFIYFQLYYRWGEVQLVTTGLSPEKLNIPRAENGGTVNLIFDDLEFAIQNLPNGQPEEGRFDKGAAMALKARILLYEASPLANQEGDASKWRLAATAAKEVIDLSKYQLFQEPDGSGYSALFLSENENSNEIIIDRENHDVVGLGNQLVRLLSTNPSSTTFLVPTQSLVDSYETYDSSTDQIISVDPSNPFLNRDPRLDYSIGHEGSDFYGSTLNPNTSPLIKSVTGYSIHKFLTTEFNPNNPGNSGLDSPVNHILMRYAEILLIYAEAKIEAGDIDQSVLDAINDIKARAYGVNRTDFNSYPEVSTTDQLELRNIVRNERHVELALEGLRWYDIRRWKIAEIVRNQAVQGVQGPIVDRVFDASRDYFWPIPQREIDLIGVDILEQNPRY